MKIFVTGATGYIGQKLTTRLLNQGHEIHALCRTVPEGDLFHNPHIKIHKGDLSSVSAIANASAGCEQVYHLAGYARVWAKDVKTFFEVNVQGTVNVLEASLKAGVKKVVITSTGGTYGTGEGQLINETTTARQGFFTDYETSKFMAEEKVHRYIHKGLPVVIVNPARVYGPGTLTESNALSFLIKSYVTGDWHIIPGNGNTISSFTYIDNVIDGHLLAMEKGVSGERYILGGINTDFNTFFSVLGKLSGKDYLLFRIPLPFMLLYAYKEEVSARIFKSQPVITPQWVRKFTCDAPFSSEKAITNLGYNITTLEEGISRTLAWLQQDMKIYY
jgi:farnesol dehydrogenase